MSSTNHLYSLCILAALAGLAAAGCIEGSGIYAEEARLVPRFDGLELQNGLRADLRVVPEQQCREELTLTVSGDDNLIGYVRARVEGSRLVLDVDARHDLAPDLPLQITGPACAVHDVRASGGSQVLLQGITAASAQVHLSGGSQLDASGCAEELGVQASGGSQLRARGLKAQRVTLKASGGSQARVCASKLLEVELSGGSGVDAYCSPAEIRESTSGGSRVRRYD